MRRAAELLMGGRLKAERLQPPAVPAELLGDFVRGYFEGDGNIYFDEPRSNLHVRIAGRTRFIENLTDVLVERGVFTWKRPRILTNTTDIVELHVQSAEAFRLAHLMYDGAPAALSLSRKRAVYERCKAWRLARGLRIA